MRTAIFPVVALVVLTGCALSQPITDPTLAAHCGNRPVESQVQDAVNTYIQRAGLKDPGSAQTRRVSLDGPTKWNSIHGSIVGWQVSFEMNAKNSFGAYVGFQRREVMILPDGSFRWRNVQPIY